ncbi:copper-binding protein [Rhodococcus spelaei]|uniref:Copper-binding protein n=1 Tax=Rhodococcus spelaei TaxID=2546320 RepID=A0A541B0R0_9NOCA|nr:plastocyanin/azurin family copper-binding protein [Rhodococcus spelaei]TQF65901.1 copper-binding protein [Rhodococcus spelaei]
MQAPSLRACGVIVTSGLLFASVIAGCAQPTQSAEVMLVVNRTTTVTISNMMFHPSTIRVHIGDTVTWAFNDQGLDHEVVSQPSAQQVFDSGVLSSGTYSFTFTEKGTNAYTCAIHSSMAGTVIVS